MSVETISELKDELKNASESAHERIQNIQSLANVQIAELQKYAEATDDKTTALLLERAASTIGILCLLLSMTSPGR